MVMVATVLAIVQLALGAVLEATATDIGNMLMAEMRVVRAAVENRGNTMAITISKTTTDNEPMRSMKHGPWTMRMRQQQGMTGQRTQQWSLTPTMLPQKQMQAAMQRVTEGAVWLHPVPKRRRTTSRKL